MLSIFICNKQLILSWHWKKKHLGSSDYIRILCVWRGLFDGLIPQTAVFPAQRTALGGPLRSCGQRGLAAGRLCLPDLNLLEGFVTSGLLLREHCGPTQHSGPQPLTSGTERVMCMYSASTRTFASEKTFGVSYPD